MAENLDVIITLKDQATAGLKGVSSGFDDFAAKAKGVGIAMTAVGTAITGFMGLAVNSAAESEKVEAQLDAVLKSTASAAGVTADAAKNLAAELQKVTKFSDEEILSAENLMLTFTKVSKDVFPEATKIVLDMSTALGQDLKSSTVQLGKALQDPIKGITALSRVGVNFSDTQKEMIEKMVEAGDVMGAQKLILAELKTEFGGSAEAAGKTFGGQLAILKNELDNVMETIGQTLIPILGELMEKLKPIIEKVTEWIKQHPELFKNIVLVTAVIGGLLLVLGPLLIMLPGIVTAIKLVGLAFTGLNGPVGVIMLAITAVTTLVTLLVKNWDRIKTFFGFGSKGVPKGNPITGGFASGGIVGGSGSGDTVHAMVSPGELILNKAQQRNLAGNMGGVTINVQGNFVGSQQEALRFGNIIARQLGISTAMV